MVESKFEEMLKEILQEINNNQDINKENVIDEIRDKLEKRFLPKTNQKENVIDEVRDKLEKRFPFKINQDDCKLEM
ncbi:hypothetical protein [Wolbachia endosymbiont (group A) of Anomoia purmunda]|uniref:hypothetical protein n=1 Tax=Wolbachia endosymbiont (group A) of Anomoia purmunda TaxID=2953978 RepID=UPI00222ECA03|nr:hypothetical protein [Wolbachia endosymbiont (group A) of Anomoia purmunda]